jgi:hypothetical protein
MTTLTNETTTFIKIGTFKRTIRASRRADRRLKRRNERTLQGELRNASQRSLKRHLQIERVAQQNGASNCPQTTETTIDVTQQGIVGRCEAGMRALQTWVSAEFTWLLKWMPYTEAASHSFTVDGIRGELQAEITKLQVHAKGDLASLRKSERDALRQLNLFKAMNGLTRAAHFPLSPLLALALAAMVLGESVANAYLFAEGNEFGLLGGWLQAGIVSLANVAMSFVIGLFVLPNLHYIRWWRRAMGQGELMRRMRAVRDPEVRAMTD